jgi:uncharacterized membrane protein YeiH
MARDVVLAEVPIVLRSELYAVAALAGATVVVLGDQLGVSSPVATLLGALLCFGLRVVAVRRGWRLPVADPHDSSAGQPPSGELEHEQPPTM